MSEERPAPDRTGTASHTGTVSRTGTASRTGTGGAVLAPPPNVTLVTRTLLLLPALVGLVGIGATVLAGVAGGVVDGRQGWTATIVAALAVTVTVVTGGSYG
ncbi:MAG: hypothetical protein AAF531_07640, partial [Actinomycetota bacterium]